MSEPDTLKPIDEESAEKLAKRVQMYESAFARSSAPTTGILIVMDVVLISMTAALIFVLYGGFSKGYLEDFPVLTALLIVIIGLVVGVEIWLLMIAYANYRLSPEYKLHGQVLFATEYNPGSHVFGDLGEHKAIWVFIVILLVFPVFFLSTDAFSIIVPLLVFWVALWNFFSPRHYILTDEGYGYLFEGIRPIMVFLGWDSFSGYELRGTDIQLITGLPASLFPTKIKAGKDVEKAREVIDRYLPRMN